MDALRKAIVLGGGLSLFARVQALYQGGAVHGVLLPVRPEYCFEERASQTTQSTVGGVVGSRLSRRYPGDTYIAVAPSDAARPILRQSGYYYYLEYDGVDDCFQVLSFTFSNRFFIGLAAQITSNGLLVEHSVKANPNDGFYFHSTNLQAFLVYRSAAHLAAGVANWSGTDLAVFDLVYSDDEQQHYKDAVAQTLGSIGGTLAAQSNVTDTLNIFGRNAFAFIPAGDEYGMLLIDGNRSAADVALMRQYLASISGVSL